MRKENIAENHNLSVKTGVSGTIAGGIDLATEVGICQPPAMIRREFIKKSGVAVATAGASSTALGQFVPKHPNIVIVHCDELNFRTIGCYRDTLSEEQAFMWGPTAVCETPHIDSIAKEGAICTKFYAATPVCSPSRSSLLSGQYPQNTPVTNNSVHMSDEVITFAHQLKKNGYRTGYAGKWHLDGEGKPQWEPERNFGFDDNRYMFNRGHWKQFELTADGPRVKARNKKGEPSYSVQGADEKSFATDWLTDRAIEFIREGDLLEPFLYLLSIPDPHGPDTVRAPYDTMFDDADVRQPRTYNKDPDSAPSWAKPEEKCHWKMAQYHGMMKCIDDNVGRLIAALKEAGVYDDTIFIFTADHGDMRGEHHRQNKGVPMEASAKIPFLIRWPKGRSVLSGNPLESVVVNGIPAGQQIDHAMNTTDFMPTILAMAGADPSGKEEGRDLSGVLAGGELEGKDITFMRGTTQSAGDTGGWIAAVTPTHKLILSSKDKAWLLNLDKDPDEIMNFVDDPEERTAAAALAKELKRYAETCGDAKIKDPHTKATLEALLV